MHLHLGFDAAGLSDLEMHHIIVNSWEGGVDTEQVHVLSCTPIVFASRLPFFVLISLAGFHVMSYQELLNVLKLV